MAGRCQGINCGKPAAMRCPKCVQLKLKPALFCDQTCFQKNYAVHKILHKIVTGAISGPNPWPTFQFTGELRPHYPLSKPRKIPAEIPHPDYAVDGRPTAEIQARSEQYAEPMTPEMVQKLRKVCRLSREVLDIAGRMIKPGVTGDEIDAAVHAACIERKSYPSPLNYYNFPKSCCVSVNEVICHGIPDHRPLQDGDIVNVDITLYHDGVHGDMNETYFVGNVSPEVRNLVDVTRQCLEKAIAIVKPGVAYRDLGQVIQDHAEAHGLSVNRTYCGHGIHRHFHCAPNIPHYAKNKAVGTMEVGHVFTIEPMINLGRFKDKSWPDNWTAVTIDGKPSAQFEQMMIVTENGCEVMSARIDDELTNAPQSSSGNPPLP